MKICAVISEYNPLHNGHLKQIEYIKNTLNYDKLIVVMSGNFTQRGESAVMNKFTRARQAVIAGADMVIELPTIYATANAEIFGAGAIKLINDLNIVDAICFGVESGDEQAYITTARALLTETKEFKQALKKELETGVSLVKAKFNVIKALNIADVDEKLISSPNNILGLEYTKALLNLKSDIKICPMIREGSANHNDKTLKKGISSATSIRLALKTKKSKVKKAVPSFVYSDLPKTPVDFNKVIMAKLITTPAEEMTKILDCTEGLENRIKALIKDNQDFDVALSKITTKRYTTSRIRRITIATLLNITEEFIRKCLDKSTYAKVLAVNKDSMDLLKALTENTLLPVLTRKSDFKTLSKLPLECFEIDVLANDLYNLVAGEKQSEYHMEII